MARERPRMAATQTEAAATAGVALALGTAAIILGTALVGTRRRNQLARVRSHPDSAPPEARRAVAGGRVLTGNAVRINRPRQELYAFWRDFANLPSFMENVQAVRSLGNDRSEWTIAAPMGSSVTLRTEVTEARDGELIAWRTLEGSDLAAEGRVSFRDAPGGRGSIVAATVAYKPPGGEIGRWIAKLFGREPDVQGRRELRRFKMLMETGEIATAENHAGEDHGAENHAGESHEAESRPVEDHTDASPLTASPTAASPGAETRKADTP